MTTELKAQLLSMFIQYVLPVLATAFATAASWALVKLGAYLAAKGSASKFAQVGARLAHLSDVVVADLEATLRPRLVAAAADGKLDKTEILQLRAVALERLKRLAGEQGLNEAKAILGILAPNLDTYLTGVIERAVDRLPPSTDPAPAAPAPATNP